MTAVGTRRTAYPRAPKSRRSGVRTAGDGYRPLRRPIPREVRQPQHPFDSWYGPVVASGDESELSSLDSLNLPNGKYLISITAPGFKIDGVHFIVNGGVITADNKVLVGHQLEATMNPMPVQTTTVRVNVFNDNAVPDGAWDGLSEPGLSGFSFHMTDVLGNEVTTDVTATRSAPSTTAAAARPPRTSRPPVVTVDYATFDALPIDLDADGVPMPIDSTGGYLPDSRSGCVSNGDGQIQVPNLGPNRYAYTVVAPDADQHVVDTRANSHGKTVEVDQDDDTRRWSRLGHMEPGRWHGLRHRAHRRQRADAADRRKVSSPSRTGCRAIPGRDDGSVEGSARDRSRLRARPHRPGQLRRRVGSAGTKTAGPIKDGVVALTCIAGLPEPPHR